MILGIFILFYSILCFILLVGSATMSGFCGFTAQLADGNFTVFDELNLGVDQRIIDTFTVCGSSDGSGDLTDVIFKKDENGDNTQIENDIENYERFVDFLDGYTAYEVYRTTKGDTSQAATGIKDLEDEWKLYQDGTKQNFLQVTQTLNSLNDLVKCDNKEYGLSQVSCDGSDCISIADTDNFSAPSCSEDGNTAQKHFDNLKKYFTENTDLITLMINDLTAEDKPSPKLYFERGETDLNNVESDYQSVNEKFTQTFSVVNDYKTNYREVIDCRVIRAQILRFEQEVCFKFVFYVYILMVLACISCIFLLVAAWMACCALRTDGGVDDDKDDESEPEDKDVFKDDYDLDDFEEEEIIPNF